MTVLSHVSSLGDQELVKSRDLSAASLSPSPGEKSEQEYLAALAAHYQVEHYEDCYNLTGQLEMINVSGLWWMSPCSSRCHFLHPKMFCHFLSLNE